MKFKLIVIILGFSGMNFIHAQVNTNPEIMALKLELNHNFPNNAKWEVLLYKQVFDMKKANVDLIEETLSENNWRNSWRNGIYSFQHYHSTAHEVLVVYSGWAEVQLGGPGNQTLKIEAGDLIVLPAGTAHKKIDSGNGFAVLGAYPDNQSWDMNEGKPEELEGALKNIELVKLPTLDPVFGKNGLLFTYWK